MLDRTLTTLIMLQIRRFSGLKLIINIVGSYIVRGFIMANNQRNKSLPEMAFQGCRKPPETVDTKVQNDEKSSSFP